MNAFQKFSLIPHLMQPDRTVNAAVFNTMRILKKVNPGDTYLENYLWHYNKRQDKFLDYYHFLWHLGPVFNPQYMMEIGCRTGISICQLLSSMMNYEDKRVFLFDLFGDGFISPDLVRLNMRYLNIPTDIVEFFPGNSLETVPMFGSRNYEQFVEKLDYILVDGCHDKPVAQQDLENVEPLLARGGILIFDDIAEDGCNLIDVWEEFKQKYADRFYFCEDMNGKGFGVGVKKDDAS